MIQVHVPETEYFDEATNEFVFVKEKTLQLEHSLLSISKWESKWCKPFLGKEEKTEEQLRDYIRCMTITPNVDPLTYLAIPASEMKRIWEYINAPMTATWFSDRNKTPPSRKIITSELIYYWMTAQNIPFECEKWHLNRLFTLIRVCSEKNQPPKKMGKKEAARRQRSLNAQRRAANHTTG